MEIRHYAKRQMTWFGKNKEIHWVAGKKEAERLVNAFLRSPISDRKEK